MKNNLIIVLSVALLFSVGGLVYVLNTRISPITTIIDPAIPTKTVPLTIDNTETEVAETKLLSVDTSPEAVADWETYENKKFGFGIKYPCNLECKKSTVKGHKSEYLAEIVYLPPPLSINDLSIQIGLITKESVESFSEYLRNIDPDVEIGDAQPFKFLLSEMEKVILLPVGSNTELSMHYNKEFKTPVQIININNKKAIVLNSNNRHISNSRDYFVKHTDNKWVILKESYWNMEGFLQDASTLTDGDKKKILISNAILNTLYFID